VVKTVKRQAGAAHGCMATDQSLCARVELQPRLHAYSIVTHSAATSAVCGLWRYISVYLR